MKFSSVERQSSLAQLVVATSSSADEIDEWRADRRRDRNKRVLCHRGGHTQGVVSLVLKSPYPSGDGAICSRRPDKGDRSKSGAGRRVGLGGVVWRGEKTVGEGVIISAWPEDKEML